MIPHPMYVSQKAFVLNKEGKFLTLFRTESALARPHTWDVPGGVLETGEDPEEAVRREIREEAGIEVTEVVPLTLVGEYSKRNDYVITVAYLARATDSDVTLSDEHSAYRWVSVDEFLELESSQKWMDIAEKFRNKLV